MTTNHLVQLSCLPIAITIHAGRTMVKWLDRVRKLMGTSQNVSRGCTAFLFKQVFRLIIVMTKFVVTLLKEILIHGFQIQLSIDKSLITLFVSSFVSKHITALVENNPEKKIRACGGLKDFCAFGPPFHTWANVQYEFHTGFT